MSVPTHNLYDFVHLATKKQFLLLYFYPWGSRDLNDVCHHVYNDEILNGPGGIDPKYQLGQHLLGNCDAKNISHLQPILFCYDQEPLNFDLYSDSNPLVQQYKKDSKNSFLFFSDRHKNLNLKWQNVDNCQKTWTLLHSELNSHELTLYEDTGLFKGAYWWSHAVIARDWYRYAEYDSNLKPVTDWKKLFLVYCRDTTGSRQYRKKFLNLISDLDCQTTSFDNKSVGSDASAIYNVVDHNSSAISVVLETVFDQRIHLTEKTLRPIACGHPFILAAGPGSLSLLRYYGFKTFNPYIDESYDLLQDESERLIAITNSMRKFQQSNSIDQHYALKHCQEIAAYNQQHFFSKRFFDQIIDELSRNVDTAYQCHQGVLDLSTWWKEHRWRKCNFSKFCQSSEYKKYSRNLISLYRQQRTNAGILHQSSRN